MSDATATEGKSWVWSSLERMAVLAAQKELAEKEAERLTAEYAAERGRVLEAAPDLQVEGAIHAIRLLGVPPGATAAPAPAETADAPTSGDPLEIPEYLRRKTDAGAAERQGTTNNDAETMARTAPT